MRLPRVRFTVRMLIFAVAFVAISIGLYRESRRLRVARYRAVAEAHAREAEWLLEEPRLRRLMLTDIRDESHRPKMSSAEMDQRFHDRLSQIMMRRAKWHQNLSLKYRYLAANPWEGPFQGPPEPD